MRRLTGLTPEIEAILPLVAAALETLMAEAAPTYAALYQSLIETPCILLPIDQP